MQAALAKHKERKMAVPMPSKRRSLVVQTSMDAYTPPGEKQARCLLPKVTGEPGDEFTASFSSPGPCSFQSNGAVIQIFGTRSPEMVSTLYIKLGGKIHVTRYVYTNSILTFSLRLVNDADF